MNEMENQLSLERPGTTARKITALDLNRWASDSALPRCPTTVLLALIRTVDNDTHSWPSGGEEAPGGIGMTKLGERAKYSKRSTQRGARVLEELGLIKVTQRAWQVNAFQIFPDKIKEFSADKKAARALLRAMEHEDDEDIGEEEEEAPTTKTEQPTRQDMDPAGVPLPSWAVYLTRAHGIKGPEAVEIVRVVVEAIQGQALPSKIGVHARPILRLYEHLGRPDLASWVYEIKLVAEAAAACGERLWHRTRGYVNGLKEYENNQESPRELCRVSKWEERLAAAHRHAEHHCACASHTGDPDCVEDDRLPTVVEPEVVVPLGQEAGYCTVHHHDLLAVWMQARENVANAHGTVADIWLKDVAPDRVEDGTAVLVVLNRHIRDQIATNYLPEIQAAFGGAIGFSLVEATGPPGSRSRP